MRGEVYNLACAYALEKNKEKALQYLKESLEKKQISNNHVIEDLDWQYYLEDTDFIALVA
jgi:hypothetical protein